MYLELDRLSKQFDGKYAVHDLSLGLEEGGLLCILGSSGCGKTTTLNMIGGFLKPDGGRVLLDRQDITALPPERRPVSTVFQSYGLFPHMSVLQNVTYGLKFRGYSRAEAKEKGRRYLSLVGLAERENARISELSGGQQQRVAIARALATNPKVLLCDEATSALDPKTTRQILELIRDINKKLGITVVIITHQMSVVKEVCNHVAILDDGIIAEEGLVSSVFTSPKSEAARHLVFPGGEDMTVSDPMHERRLKLTFLNVAATSVPLVARLATEEGISANVISATTQKLSDEIYGSMLLGIPNSQFDKATAFLKNFENIKVEEVSADD